jgi:hypothetical protein
MFPLYTQKNIPGPNALAYFAAASVTQKYGFITLTLEVEELIEKAYQNILQKLDNISRFEDKMKKQALTTEE